LAYRSHYERRKEKPLAMTPICRHAGVQTNPERTKEKRRNNNHFSLDD
jgi:hypothetical protein